MQGFSRLDIGGWALECLVVSRPLSPGSSYSEASSTLGDVPWAPHGRSPARAKRPLPSLTCVPWETRAPPEAPDPRRVPAQPSLRSVLAVAWPAHPFLWAPQCQGGGPVNKALLCSGPGRGGHFSRTSHRQDPMPPAYPLPPHRHCEASEEAHPMLRTFPTPRGAATRRSGGGALGLGPAMST